MLAEFLVVSSGDVSQVTATKENILQAEKE
jgi:hypothetical protein